MQKQSHYDLTIVDKATDSRKNGTGMIFILGIITYRTVGWSKWFELRELLLQQPVFSLTEEFSINCRQPIIILMSPEGLVRFISEAIKLNRANKYLI